jgi:hypothetical protein
LRRKPDAVPIAPALPVDLADALQRAWQMVCEEYDAIADLPDMATLFEGADVTTPIQAAETVVANLLLEVMGHISRFSPWHKRPMGLRRIQDGTTHRARWGLSPSSYSQWQALIRALSYTIEKNIGLILAADLVDPLIGDVAPADDRIWATCACVPGRIIRIRPTFLDRANVVCDACQRPFHPIAGIDAGHRNNLRID